MCRSQVFRNNISSFGSSLPRPNGLNSVKMKEWDLAMKELRKYLENVNALKLTGTLNQQQSSSSVSLDCFDFAL